MFFGWLVRHNIVHSHACRNCKIVNTPIERWLGENVGGHIYDRQRCSGKLEGHAIAVIIFLGMVGS